MKAKWMALVGAVALAGLCANARDVKFREFKNLPDLLKIESGGRVPLHSNYGWSMQAWERQRRLEILRFFTDNEFGHRPVERPKQLAFAASHETVLSGKAEKWRVRITYRRAPGEKPYGITVVGYRPVSDEPVAPMLTLFETDPETLFDAAHPERETGKWPVTKILARGYAALALDVNEIAADATASIRPRPSPTTRASSSGART